MLLIILLIHLSLLIKTTFTLWPEMVVYPYLLNNGFYLYKDIINPYPPVLPYFLSIFAKLFGYQPAPYQIMTWVIILLLDLVIFFITKSLFKKSKFAYASTLIFAVLSVPFGINGLWFDLIQAPIILLSTYFIYVFFETNIKKNMFLSFFLLTIAFFIKQQVYIIFLWFLLIIIFKFKKHAIKLLTNPVLYLPFLTLSTFFLIVFYKQDVLDQFIYWVVYFPPVASKLPGYVLFPSLKQFLPVLALIIIAMPSLQGKYKFFPLSAIVYALLAYPRFDYFHLLPTLALIALIVPANVAKIANQKFPYKIIMISAFIFLVFFSARFIVKNKSSEVRFFEKEIIMTSSFLRQIANQNESIYIQNGPDQLLPLSGTLPTKPWADEFPWYLEMEKIQEQVLAGIKSANPRIVVYKPYTLGSAYELGSYKPQMIASYLESNYHNLIKISENFWLKGPNLH